MSAKREKRKRAMERLARYRKYQTDMNYWLRCEPERKHFILYWLWQRRMPKWEG